MSGNALSTAVVDRIVSRIYDSVKNSPLTGFFDLKADVVQSNNDPTMVGSPSSYTFNKLRTLLYSWASEYLPGNMTPWMSVGSIS